MPGVMLNAGWVSPFDEQDFEEIIQVHEEKIKRRAAAIRAGSG